MIMSAMTHDQLVQVLQASMPARVGAAMNFVTAMRTTGYGHMGSGEGREVCATDIERGTYNAAIELMRVYFNGEMYPDCDRKDPDDPPPGQGAVLNPPEPPAAPAVALPEQRLAT